MDMKQSGEPENTRLTNGRLVVLIAIFLLVPHTLYVEIASAVDNSYTSWMLIALVWVFSYTYGSNIAGPYSGVSLSLPDIWYLALSAGMILPSILLVWAVYQHSLGGNSTRIRLAIIIAVAVILILSAGIFSFALDAWYHTFAIPFPLLQLLGCLLVYRKPMKQVKAND
jgi:hypothetical protein